MGEAKDASKMGSNVKTDMSDTVEETKLRVIKITGLVLDSSRLWIKSTDEPANSGKCECRDAWVERQTLHPWLQLASPWEIAHVPWVLGELDSHFSFPLPPQ